MGWNDSFGAGTQLAMPSLTPMVRRLLLANVAVWLVLYFADFFDSSLQRAALDVLGVTPSLWSEWFPKLPVWQPLTYGFLHVALGHVLFNMLGLYFFGTMLEEIVGSRSFLALYLVAVVAGGLLSLVVGVATNSPATTLGASGGVMAVVVATAVLRPDTRVIFLIFPLTLKVMALIFVGMDVFSALDSLKGQGSNVSWTSHLAGAAVGFVAARKGLVWRDPLQVVERWQHRREEEQRDHDEERLDDILAKINREGIQSLSAREKAFLKRTSRRR